MPTRIAEDYDDIAADLDCGIAGSVVDDVSRLRRQIRLIEIEEHQIAMRRGRRLDRGRNLRSRGFSRLLGRAPFE